MADFVSVQVAEIVGMRTHLPHQSDDSLPVDPMPLPAKHPGHLAGAKKREYPGRSRPVASSAPNSSASRRRSCSRTSSGKAPACGIAAQLEPRMVRLHHRFPSIPAHRPRRRVLKIAFHRQLSDLLVQLEAGPPFSDSRIKVEDSTDGREEEMSKRNRKRYSAEFKAKVALAALQRGCDAVGDCGTIRDPPEHGEPVETPDGRGDVVAFHREGESARCVPRDPDQGTEVAPILRTGGGRFKV